MEAKSSAQQEKPENVLDLLAKESKRIRKIESICKKLEDNKLETISDLFAQRQNFNKIEKEISPLGDGNLKQHLLGWINSEKGNLVNLEITINKNFTSSLIKCFERNGLSLKGVMPRLTIGFYTLLFKPGSNKCEFFYGPLEEKIAVLPLDPQQIVDKIKSHHDSLLSSSTELPHFITQLEEAIQRVIRNSNRTSGGQIPIIDVLLEMNFIRQGNDFKENPAPSSFKGYSRVQFSFDLHRYNESSDKPLGIRLYTANRVAVKDRAKYLWIPRGESIESGSVYSYLEMT